MPAMGRRISLLSAADWTCHLEDSLLVCYKLFLSYSKMVLALLWNTVAGWAFASAA